MQRLSYVPYHLLAERPNIIVDGAANLQTRLTLSHWPHSRTPPNLKADLSAESVFKFIESVDQSEELSALLDGVEAASNNHFDEDGLVSLYSILNPDDAVDNRDFLIAVARAGDFSTYEDRDAARVSFVISAWSDPDRSPLKRTAFSGTHDELTAVLYEELLDRLPAIVARIEHFEHLWRIDDDFLTLTERAIAAGKIEISEDEAIDLAIVDIPDGGIIEPSKSPAHASSWISSVCHPMAIHNAINCNRVLVRQGRMYELYFRYETWVDFVSRPLKPRIDLTGFAERLSKMEGGGRWSFSGVDDIIARLRLQGKKESRLSPNQFVKLLSEECLQLAGSADAS